MPKIDWNEKPRENQIVNLKYRNPTIRNDRFFTNIILKQRSSLNAVKKTFIMQFHRQVKLCNTEDLEIISVDKNSNKNFVVTYRIRNLEKNYANSNLSKQIEIFMQKCLISCE